MKVTKNKRFAAAETFANSTTAPVAGYHPADKVRSRTSWTEFSRGLRATTALTMTGGLLVFAGPAMAQLVVTNTDANIVVDVQASADAHKGMVLTTNGNDPFNNNIQVINTKASDVVGNGVDALKASVNSPLTSSIIQVQ